MKLTIGQKKALVTAYVFGLSEINGGAFRGLSRNGLLAVGPGKTYSDRLSPLGIEVARGLIDNAQGRALK